MPDPGSHIFKWLDVLGLFIFYFFKDFYVSIMYVYVGVRIYAMHVSSGTCGGQKKMSNILELEL